jgi:hypothetical protein
MKITGRLRPETFTPNATGSKSFAATNGLADGSRSSGARSAACCALPHAVASPANLPAPIASQQGSAAARHLLG